VATLSTDRTSREARRSRRLLARIRTPPRRPSGFRDAYKKFLDQYSLEKIALDDDFAAATRDKSTGRKVFL
jgi:hypothetical protein